MIVENGVYSDLLPSNAPYWSCNVAFHAAQPALMRKLSKNAVLNSEYCGQITDDTLTAFINLTRIHATVNDVLGIETEIDDDEQRNTKSGKHALHRLAPATVGIPTVQRKAAPLPLSMLGFVC
jgi:hypothetical protein